MISLSIMEDDLLFQMDFSLSFWRITFLQICLVGPGFSIDVLCPFPFFAASCSKKHFPRFV